jgi:hypothetical protein
MIRPAIVTASDDQKLREQTVITPIFGGGQQAVTNVQMSWRTPAGLPPI